jgi:mycothiol synthase
VLDLPSATLDAAPVDGYRLASWTGRAPDAVVESYALARNAMNDAPASNDSERYVSTVETVRGDEAMLEQRGRQLRVTVALDSSGAAVAFTELRVSPDQGAVASTEDTGTVAEHRGRGLAGWVKAESLRRLRDDRPDVRLVTTTNAAQNAPILALNRRLGFERAAVATTASVSLAGASVQ